MASVAEALNHSCPTNRSIVLPYEASRSDAASQSAMTIIVFLRHLETNTSRGLLLTCWYNQTNRRPFDVHVISGRDAWPRTATAGWYALSVQSISGVGGENSIRPYDAEKALFLIPPSPPA